MMQGNDRGDAVFAIVSVRPGFAALQQAEKDSVQAQLRTLFSADTVYIQGAAEVRPGTLNNPAGQSVATTGGPAAQSGATTASQVLQGLGVVR